MNSTQNRKPLLHHAFEIFIGLSLAVSVLFWYWYPTASPNTNSVHLGARTFAALKTFEWAITPRAADYTEPDAATVSEYFRFCEDPFVEGAGEKAKREASELADRLRTINLRLRNLTGTGRTGENTFLKTVYAVDLQRWAHTVRAERNALDEAERFSCHDALRAAGRLANNNAAMLERLEWRERLVRPGRTPSEQIRARFANDRVVHIADTLLALRNPWDGIPGCIYLASRNPKGDTWFVSDGQGRNHVACTAEAMHGGDRGNPPKPLSPSRQVGSLAADNPEWMLPDSLDTILDDLSNIRFPGRALYAAYTEPATGNDEHPEGRHGPNRLRIGGRDVAIGFNVHLTIDPRTQAIANKVARCYTGEQSICKMIGLSDIGREMYEQAAARMVGIAVVDIASGRIDAIASGHSNCYRQDYDGPGRDTSRCPNLPFEPRYVPDQLLNHALFTDAMPGSIVKPILAAGFFADPGYRRTLGRAAGLRKLQGQLRVSDSPAFLNRMFCSDLGWQNCSRPRYVQVAANGLGWNLGCSIDKPSVACGRLDVLFGRPTAARLPSVGTSPISANVIYGRLLTESDQSIGPGVRLIRKFDFDPKDAKACSDQGWRKCRGGHLVDLESEGWGQKNARSTALGVAGLFARLAAAANGAPTVAFPHLVERVADASNRDLLLAARRFQLAEPEPIDIVRTDARNILGGMEGHQQGGTASRACKRVFPTSECNRKNWLSGKTGTLPYTNALLRLDQIAKNCALKPRAGEERRWRESCSYERPYKWYAAVWRSDPKGAWSKAIAVLAERNWNQKTRVVDTPLDESSTVAGEIAFRLIQALGNGSPSETAPSTKTRRATKKTR